MELGVSFKGDYLSQGSKEDKIIISNKLGITNIEVYIKENGKDMNLSAFKKKKENVIVHLPIYSNYENNIMFIKNMVPLLVENNIKEVIVDASAISSETIEWSTDEEKSIYLNNIGDVLTYIANNEIKVLIENTTNGLYGNTISDISEILVVTRNMLINKYKSNKDKAKELINVCLNVSNIIDNIDEWINIFSEDINIVKITRDQYNKVIEFISKSDKKLLLEFKDELESLEKEYLLFRDTLNNDERVDIKKEENGGFTNVIVLTIILCTAICAVLMILVKIRG